MQKHSEYRECAISSPLWATGNDAQKLHAPQEAYYYSTAFAHEVLSCVGLGTVQLCPSEATNLIRLHNESSTR